MKISFVVDVFPSASETFILNQITYLINQGHNVTIYSRIEGKKDIIHDSIIEYKLMDKILYYPPKEKSALKRLKAIYKSIIKTKSMRIVNNFIKCLNIFKLGRPALSLYVAYNYSQLWSIENSDVIHAHFGTSAIFVCYLKKAGVLKNTNIITSFHGSDLSPDRVKINKILYKTVFSHSKLLTVNTLYSFDLLTKITDDLDKIRILPVGLDTQKFKKSNNPIPYSNCINITFCGRLIHLKGAHIAIEIINKLVKSFNLNLKLYIIGDGPDYKLLHKLQSNLQLEDIVCLLGALDQNEVRKVLSFTDIFLFPGTFDPKTGRCETQGLVIQEAQAMEIPVVISDVGGMKYGVVNEVTGFVVEDRNIGRYVEVLVNLCLNPELREKMGKAGREYVISHYDSRHLGKKLLDFYKSIL